MLLANHNRCWHLFSVLDVLVHVVKFDRVYGRAKLRHWICSQSGGHSLEPLLQLLDKFLCNTLLDERARSGCAGFSRVSDSAERATR
jgi:hypothetical protein